MSAFKCENCGKTTAGNEKFCIDCGQALNIVCPDCGLTWRFMFVYKFCPTCGYNLEKKEEIKNE
jgi:hypothetical protein